METMETLGDISPYIDWTKVNDYTLNILMTPSALDDFNIVHQI